MTRIEYIELLHFAGTALTPAHRNELIAAIREVQDNSATDLCDLNTEDDAELVAILRNILPDTRESHQRGAATLLDVMDKAQSILELHGYAATADELEQSKAIFAAILCHASLATNFTPTAMLADLRASLARFVDVAP